MHLKKMLVLIGVITCSLASMVSAADWSSNVYNYSTTLPGWQKNAYIVYKQKCTGDQFIQFKVDTMNPYNYTGVYFWFLYKRGSEPWYYAPVADSYIAVGAKEQQQYASDNRTLLVNDNIGIGAKNSDWRPGGDTITGKADVR